MGGMLRTFAVHRNDKVGRMRKIDEILEEAKRLSVKKRQLLVEELEDLEDSSEELEEPSRRRRALQTARMLARWLLRARSILTSTTSRPTSTSTSRQPLMINAKTNEEGLRRYGRLCRASRAAAHALFVKPRKQAGPARVSLTKLPDSLLECAHSLSPDPDVAQILKQRDSHVVIRRPLGCDQNIHFLPGAGLTFCECAQMLLAGDCLRALVALTLLGVALSSSPTPFLSACLRRGEQLPDRSQAPPIRIRLSPVGARLIETLQQLGPDLRTVALGELEQDFVLLCS